MSLVSLVLAAALLFSLRPAPAQAQASCGKEEDVAAVDQYCPPKLPGPEGEEAPPRPPLEEGLPRSIVKKLKKEGAAGEALLDLERVAPAAIVEAQNGGRMKKVVDAERLLAIGALGSPVKPQSAARILAKIPLGEGFAKTFRWGMLGTTFLLIGASWMRYRTRSGLS